MAPRESQVRAQRTDTNKTGDLEAPVRVTGEGAGGRETDPEGSLSVLMPNTSICRSFKVTVMGERSGTGEP